MNWRRLISPRSWELGSMSVTLWAGVYRGAARVSTVWVSLHWDQWALPLSFGLQAHLVSYPGVTVGIGPVYISWGWVPKVKR
jgi:hypothetical protein